MPGLTAIGPPPLEDRAGGMVLASDSGMWATMPFQFLPPRPCTRIVTPSRSLPPFFRSSRTRS